MKKHYLFLVIHLLLLQGATAQEPSFDPINFDIGTKWTYEEVRSWPPITQRANTYEITGQTTWQDTSVYVIEPGVYGALEYLYIQGDSIYFWDWRTEAFQLNYDFSASQSYATVWSGSCFDVGPNTANITLDSVRQETIFDHTLEVQYTTAQGDLLAPTFARIYKGIGNDYGLKYGLGEDCDSPWHIEKLRCFEDGENSYRFVDYPCDSTLFVSTDEVLEEENEIRIYPNPSSGKVMIKHDLQYRDFPYRIYDLTGRLIQEGMVQGGQIEIEQAGKYIVVLENDGIHRPYRITIMK